MYVIIASFLCIQNGSKVLILYLPIDIYERVTTNYDESTSHILLGMNEYMWYVIVLHNVF